MVFDFCSKVGVQEGFPESNVFGVPAPPDSGEEIATRIIQGSVPPGSFSQGTETSAWEGRPEKWLEKLHIKMLGSAESYAREGQRSHMSNKIRDTTGIHWDLRGC